MSKPRPTLYDSPAMPKIMKAMSAAHATLYRATGGLLGRKLRTGAAFPHGAPVCLLITIGRKSGKARTAPLLYLRDGDRLVVVASKGGMPSHPLWYLNLQAHPEVLVQIGREKRSMRARTADEQERAELWPRLVDMYSDYAQYQEWTDRRIPVVICEPFRR